jgi:protein-tyrosine-phosphatase
MANIEMEIESRVVNDGTVMYVCWNNVGRSQMAEAFHNQLIPEGAISSGVSVDEPGGKVKDWSGGAEPICAAMDEVGLPIGENRRTQYSEDLARECGLTVFILTVGQMPMLGSVDGEEGHIEAGDNQLFWPMYDPRDVPVEKVREVRDLINDQVNLLVRSLVGVSLV